MHDHVVAKVFSFTSASVLATAGVVSESLADHIDFVKLAAWAIGGIASLTIAVMIGLDSRMDAKIKRSERSIKREISHLRELLAEKGLIHNGDSDPPTEE